MVEVATRFGIALTAGCGASCCVHPLDVIRVNLQVDQAGARQYRGMLHCGQTILRREGLRGLYAGISAGMFRQITYGGPRMAFYPLLVDAATPAGDAPGTPLPLWKKFACGATAGGVASVLGVPSEVSLVRMQADASIVDKAKARNYKHIGDALTRIWKEEGMTGYTQGMAPTLVRGMVVSATQLASRDELEGKF